MLDLVAVFIFSNCYFLQYSNTPKKKIDQYVTIHSDSYHTWKHIWKQLVNMETVTISVTIIGTISRKCVTIYRNVTERVVVVTVTIHYMSLKCPDCKTLTHLKIERTMTVY